MQRNNIHITNSASQDSISYPSNSNRLATSNSREKAKIFDIKSLSKENSIAYLSE